MKKQNDLCNEITVRLSISFHESPDLHTLLSMTPVRQRRQLIRLALEMYIVETDHPAGQTEIQIEKISGWLQERAIHLRRMHASHAPREHDGGQVAAVVATESTITQGKLPPQFNGNTAFVNDSEKIPPNNGAKTKTFDRWLSG